MRADLVGDPPAAGLVHIRDHHLSALLDEMARDLLADARACPSDQRDFVIQSEHYRPYLKREAARWDLFHRDRAPDELVPRKGRRTPEPRAPVYRSAAGLRFSVGGDLCIAWRSRQHIPGPRFLAWIRRDLRCMARSPLRRSD